MPVRLLIYDRTGERRGLGLSTCWRAGARLYGALDRIDASFGATTWDDALAWVARARSDETIEEIQYWGHGKWGSVRIADHALESGAFREGHPLHTGLCALRERLTANALVWFRTCETFGATRGIDFARRCTDFFGVRAAGHTRIIGYWQSGLRGLFPGHTPDWSPHDGLLQGTPDVPQRAHGSGPNEPRTLTCLDSAVPREWFAGARAGGG